MSRKSKATLRNYSKIAKKLCQLAYAGKPRWRQILKAKRNAAR